MNKRSHPAAVGRFASYAEIISNFSVMPVKYNVNSAAKTKTKTKILVNPGHIYSFISIFALSLILSVVIVLFTNNAGFLNSTDPVLISAEYLILWIFLFFILFFIKRMKGFDFKKEVDLKNISEETFKQNKSFKLGILRSAESSSKKKYPDVSIGLDERKRFEHLLIISPTGGGKTSRYIIPGIAADAGYSGASVFAIDIDSPFLYESVKNDWIKAGKKVVLFDPYEEGKKVYFNPLIGKDKQPLPDDKLLNLSAMLFHIDKNEIKGGDVHAHKYYSKRSEDLFYACLLYLKYRYGAKHFDLFTIKSFFERGVKFIEGEILKFNGENYKKIKNLFNNFLELPVYERAKIVTDVLNNLDFLNDSKVGSRFKCREGEGGGGVDGEYCFFAEDFFAEDTLFIAGIPKEKINSGGGRLISFITQIFIDE
ncbi:MAG: type IV secretory system conjugative DNA transfer family protein, partial [bacterium]